MLERVCIPIQEGLAEVEKALLAELVSRIDIINSVTRYVIGNGGKRIRPAVFLLAARVAGASGVHLPKLAAAIEMLHTASLLHDDVVDDAAIRRGMPSARAKWGNQVSVLVGDFLLSSASRILVESGNTRLLGAAAAAIGATTEGELLEIAHQNDVGTDAATYRQIIQGKTAALFGLAAKAPAIDVGLAPQYEDALEAFGFELGQAFQLTDDALDYVADEEKFGKAAGTDLREGKLTYPLIVALSVCTPAERSTVRNALVAGRASCEHFRDVSDIIERYGGIGETRRLARELSVQAKERLVVFKPSIEREALMMLAEYAVDRKE